MKPDKEKTTPEARLRSWIDRADPEDRKLIRAVRTALRKRLPTANELAYDYRSFFVVSYSPTERGIEGIVSFSARPDGMRLYFSSGPKLPDPKSLLQGTGKMTRFVRLQSARELADPDLEALIGAAIEHARVPLPTAGKGRLVIVTDTAARRPRRRSAK